MEQLSPRDLRFLLAGQIFAAQLPEHLRKEQERKEALKKSPPDPMSARKRAVREYNLMDKAIELADRLAEKLESHWELKSA